jgi:beta-phosphoglucomutase family hydrolase
MLKAVIFDLDGVVADSHPLHHSAWKALFAEQGLQLEDHQLDFILAGHPRREILRHYLGELSEERAKTLGMRKDELYQEIAHRLQPMPGLRELLDALDSVGIAKAVATSAAPERTRETLKAFDIVDRFPVVLVGGVTHPKPAPDIFLLAAENLNVDPRECAVIEDSVAGVQAAKSAGMACVGYTSRERWQSLNKAGADITTDELSLSLLSRIEALLTSASAARSH